MHRTLLFCTLLVGLFYPVQTDGSMRADNALFAQKQTENKCQVAVGESKIGFFATCSKHQKKGPKPKFIREGGIGKLSLWLFFPGLLLAYLASINMLTVLGVIAAFFVGIALLLALVGLFLGEENARRSKLVLLIFSGLLLVFIGLLAVIVINAD